MSLHAKLCAILTAEPLRLEVLRQVRDLNLPDCWVAAGFVRNAVWDHLHGFSAPTPLADIDVLWFDPAQASAEADARLEQALRRADNRHNWSVKNQARMHLRNADLPYASTTDAMRYWCETATAVGARLNPADQLEIAAPFGLDDLFQLLVRPTPRFADDKQTIYAERLRTKNWPATWPKLRCVEAARAERGQGEAPVNPYASKD
ncbi:nucleotidyltransferase family protein [Pseudomonas sp. 5P_3.1_Bac2]|uniref:nucleotidyltransferase family protein n=1 Tax=Pseudomonas sp. 5P_3.1_Bac2 TaxID=2971617 RepID=UPI0021CAAC55|nr:nucleotidyltransferase family protein [Pseudomonas sp. 5P_3.1_Bac2]MCU1719153.1 nucleotidyltransferase family protein [Pseudomonas sp. 5P_3.1_Bac2]